MTVKLNKWWHGYAVITGRSEVIYVVYTFIQYIKGGSCYDVKPGKIEPQSL